LLHFAFLFARNYAWAQDIPVQLFGVQAFKASCAISETIAALCVSLCPQLRLGLYNCVGFSLLRHPEQSVRLLLHFAFLFARNYAWAQDISVQQFGVQAFKASCAI